MSFRAAELGTIVSCTGSSLGSEALRAAISTRVAELKQLGLGPGSTLALMLGNSPEFFVQLFAAWELGACVMPVSPASAPAEVDSLLLRSGASCVVRDSGTSVRVPRQAAPPAGTALLLYTSGTTGAPKGVMLSFDAVTAKLAVLKAVLPEGCLERTLCFLPVSFGHGLIGNSLPSLLAGHSLYLQPAFSSSLLLGNLIDDHEITFFSSVPAVWASTLPFSAPPTKRSLRSVFCASADLTRETWLAAKNWLGADVDFRHVYGITEAASWISAVPFGEEYSETGRVGSGWSCEFAIEPGTGEVLVKAPYLMSGYHGDAEASAECLRDGFFRTGDTGMLDAHGLRLLGRLKEQINRGGLKVSPREVEEALRACSGVADACVFSLPCEINGEKVAAAVVAKGGALESVSLRAELRERLSEFKIPENIFFVASLPLSPRGKPDRRSLQEKFR